MAKTMERLAEEIGHLPNRLSTEIEIHFAALRAQSFAVDTDIHYPKGFQQQFKRHIDEGQQPIIVLNHQSHYDGLIAARICNDLLNFANPERTNLLNKASSTLGFNIKRERLKSFILIVALSILNGKQGDKKQKFHRALLPFIEGNGVEQVYVVRDKDKQKLQMTDSNRAAFEKITCAYENHQGIAVFPEETTEGGKTREKALLPHEIKGIQTHQYRKNLRPFWKERAFYITVGIDGSYLIFDPNTGNPTNEALYAATNFSQPPKVNVLVGEIYLYEQIRHILSLYNDEDIKQSLLSKKESAYIASDFIMALVASLLPSDYARGQFATDPKLSRFLIKNHPHQP